MTRLLRKSTSEATQIAKQKQLHAFIEQGFDKDVLEDIQCIQQDVHASKAYHDVIEKLRSIVQTNEKWVDTMDRDFLETCASAFVSSGLKGVLKGNRFNDRIFDVIVKEFAQHPEYEMGRESKEAYFSERCDFVITHLPTGKKMVGFNQIDFWSGGHQLNRGDKYLNNHEHVPHVSAIYVVLARPPMTLGTKSRAWKMLWNGMHQHILVWPKHLPGRLRQFRRDCERLQRETIHVSNELGLGK